MKQTFFYLLFATLPLGAEEQKPKEAESVVIAQGLEKLLHDQDELSADVQQLVIEQTLPPVIELLEKVEEIMDEATDYLSENQTGAQTLAAQTEVIETIHQAAKAKQEKQGGGKASGAMMDMMERMMGKKEEEKPKKEGQGAGQAGEGTKNGEAEANGQVAKGASNGKVEARTVPKAAGAAGKTLPGEFRAALDAYNRGLEKKNP